MWSVGLINNVLGEEAKAHYEFLLLTQSVILGSSLNFLISTSLFANGDKIGVQEVLLLGAFSL